MTERAKVATPQAVGRPKLFEIRIVLPLAAAMMRRIDACLEAGEARLDFIRKAIERELQKRERRR